MLFLRTWSGREKLLLMGLILLLLGKFLWPLFVYELPLGYDSGFYRYLFIRHGEGLPPFVVPALPSWAHGHPLGLFFFTSIALRLGIPVDWLIGWIWNLVPIVLLCVTAGVTALKEKKNTLLPWVLIAGACSVAYFDGFAAMYYKTYVALLWCVLSFHLIERRSLWAILTGVLTLVTHHQTGLLFVLALGTYGLFLSLSFLQRRPAITTVQWRRGLAASILLILGAIVCVLWYLPVWEGSIAQHMPNLLARGDVPAGSFPPPSYYMRMEGLLLLAGTMGFAMSWKWERFSLWQSAVLWSAIFVIFRLFFFRRFFLQLDFFLLPFAASAMHAWWTAHRSLLLRGGLLLLVAVQLVIAFVQMQRHGPLVDDETFAIIRSLDEILPADAFVLALENTSPVILRGWLPYRGVGGPGLFESAWSYEQWEKLILGTKLHQKSALWTLPPQSYVFVSPHYHAYYGNRGQALLAHACLHDTDLPMLYRVDCSHLPPPYSQ